MMNHIVLLINYPDLPPVSIWRNAFRGYNRISVADRWGIIKTDAAVVSVSLCEPYGCRGGTSEDTLGVMYVFDTWEFKGPDPVYPRLLISNAVWKEDPPLEVAIKRRIDILASLIASYNRTTALPISSLTIDCAVLGKWRDSPYAAQQAAIDHLRSSLPELLQETEGNP